MRVKINNATKLIRDWLNELVKGNYEPIIKVWSGPKGTRRHFLRGVKTRRNHHFLSDGEYRSGVRFEALPSTLDYFEQYPLWNLERAIRIASEMGIRYPTDKDGEAYVLSTDLVVRQYDPQSKQIIKVAKSYKPMSSLDFELRHPVSLNRTFEKLELERRYHEEEGTRFELITDAHVSKTYSDNLIAHRASAWYKHEFIAHEKPFIEAFVNSWLAREYLEIQAHLDHLKPKLALPQEQLMALFEWGIWTHQIPADLEVKINPLRPLKMLEVK